MAKRMPRLKLRGMFNIECDGRQRYNIIARDMREAEQKAWRHYLYNSYQRAKAWPLVEFRKYTVTYRNRVTDVMV